METGADGSRAFKFIEGPIFCQLLMADEISLEMLQNRDSSKAIPPLHGALVKNEQDVSLLEKLAFMHRRESR